MTLVISVTSLLQKLAVVLAQEDALSNELEAEQQEALASAIEEEENWLQALAQEQSSNIDICTDTDSDLGVGDLKSYPLFLFCKV